MRIVVCSRCGFTFYTIEQPRPDDQGKPWCYTCLRRAAR